MSDPSPKARLGLVARLVGVVVRPRTAMAAAATASFGEILGIWAVILVVWLAAGATLTSTPVGRQALVDERVRVIEALGGSVDDAAYRALQANPPLAAYFTSGGRTLLIPVVTAVVAGALLVWLRRHGVGQATYRSCLAVAVHASVVLALQQLVATPLHVVRESLTSPFNLAALLPFFDEGSLPARVLGTIELFGVWWVALLAIGCAAVSNHRARSFVGPFLVAYVLVAAAVAAAVFLTGSV